MFSTLKINQPAPHFKLKGSILGNMDIFDITQYRDKWVVLFFYPADFADISLTEVKEFNSAIKEFESKNVQILGCSVDSPFVHTAWASSLGGVEYPLLSDVHHTVSMDYSVYDEEDAHSLRGTFIIDPEGNLKWYQISNLAISPNTVDILRVIKELQA